MTSRPDVPKRLAARIRHAQGQVEEARSWIVWAEVRNRDAHARLAEHDRDPAAFAERHYRGHGPDSYPVTTTIAREREGLERRLERGKGDEGRLQEAIDNLAQVEAEVLEQVTAMRPTSGRVPWPAPLPSFAAYRTNVIAEDAAAQESSRLEREAEDAIVEAEQAEEDRRYNEDYEAGIARDRVIDQARRALLTPEQREAEDQVRARLSEALESKEISVHDIIDALKR